MMGKVLVYICLHIAPIESTAANKTRLISSPFLISTSSFLIFAEAFRNDYVAAYSTTFRSATEKNELGGYVTVAARLRSVRSDDPLSKGHPRFIKQRLKTVKTLKLTHELQYFLPKHLIHHLFIILHLGYVVDTYPPNTHTCSLCRRYVVVTYRPIIFISCKSTYPIRVILGN